MKKMMMILIVLLMSFPVFARYDGGGRWNNDYLITLLYGSGDPDSYFGFDAADSFTLVLGGVQIADADNTGFTLHEVIQLLVRDGGTIGDTTNGPYLTFDNTNDDVSVMGGNVGIGTTDPQDELDIAGKIAINGVSRVYYPDQTDFLGTMYLGNGDGGASLSHTETNDGRYNTFIGIGSGYSNTTGYNNSAIGYQSLYSNTTGNNNSAMESQSLRSNTTGNNNSAMGHASLYSNTTGNYNSAMGSYSLFSNTTGYNNSAMGYYSLRSNTTGYNNSAMGYQSLYSNTTGYNNSAMGYYSLYSNTTGNYNSAMGYQSLYSNTTGNNNSAMGYYSLYSNTTGYNNSAMGYASLYDLGIAQTAGDFNIGTSYTIKTAGDTDFTLIGSADNEVGTTFTASGAGTGTGTATPNGTNSNTAIGYNTGRGIIYGTNNTIIGANVTGLDAGLSNNIIIADGEGNQRINVDENGNVGIGTTGPGQTLALGITDVNDSPVTTDGAGFYATNVAASAEMFAVDEGGTAAQLTDDSEELYYDAAQGAYIPTARIKENCYAGIQQRLDLWKLAKAVEQLTGETIITVTPLPVEKRKNWDTDQLAKKNKRDAEIAEKQAAKINDPNVVIPEIYKVKSEPNWIKAVRKEVEKMN